MGRFSQIVMGCGGGTAEGNTMRTNVACATLAETGIIRAVALPLAARIHSATDVGGRGKVTFSANPQHIRGNACHAAALILARLRTEWLWIILESRGP